MGYIASGSHSISDDQNTSATVDYFEANMLRGSELFGELDRLDFIKCDIEGHETIVIPEIESLLKRFRPIMLIETKRQKRGKMVDYLSGLGYAAFDLRRDQLVKADESGDDDILFIHESRLEGRVSARSNS